MSEQLLRPFNPMDVMPFGGGLPSLPHGEKLLLSIEKIEVRQKAKDNNQGGVSFTIRVMEGEHTGKRGGYWLSLYDANPVAVEMAEQKLSAICFVTGVLNAGANIGLLKNIPFRADVGPQAKDPSRTDILAFYAQDGTDVSTYAQRLLSGQGAAGSPFGQQPQQQPQQAPVQPQQAPVAAAPAGFAPPAGFPGAAPAAAPQAAPAGFGFPAAPAPQQAPAGFPAAGFPAAPQQQAAPQGNPWGAAPQQAPAGNPWGGGR